MAAITLYTHFVGDLSLPNLSPSTTPEGAQAVIFINKEETHYLQTILGYELWVLFIAGITAETAIYTAIRDGATYVDTFTGRTEKWEGFATASKNPIANYIYNKIQGYRAQHTTGIGQVNATVQNGSRISPVQPMVNSWNEMVCFNEKLFGYLYANRTSYPTWIGINRAYVDDEYEALFRKINQFDI